MTTLTTLAPQSYEDVQAAICQHGRIFVRGAGSKPALAPPSVDGDDAALLDMRRLRGVVEYEPGEFVFTARAGSSLREIAALLAEHGQYLPFDPPLVDQGATLGGTIAAGLSGSGRHRYGGLRDFLIGVRFVDGQGRLVRGGGKVVKNAAGFDLPKLMIGSLGRLGVIVEASFKVFPQPPAYATLRVTQPSLDAALTTIARLNGSSFDLEALDLVFEEERPTLYVRQGGFAAALAERQERLRAWLGGGEPLPEPEEAAFWSAGREFAWAPATWALVKTPVALNVIPALDQALQAAGAQRRYVAGAALAWIAWPGDLGQLDAYLTQLQLGGLALRGEAEWPFVGVRNGASLIARVKRVLDPFHRFPIL
jgi:glycolate oxidase FAD binding subunit